MTAIRKRGSWHVDFRFERTRYRLKSPVDTKRGAEQWEAKLKGLLLAGHPLPWETTEQPEEAPPMTTKAWLEEWSATHYSAGGHKPSSADEGRRIVRVYLVPALGAIPLRDLGRRQIEAYKAQQVAEGRAPKTINNQLAVLHRALAAAVEWDVLEHAPRVQPMKTEAPEFDWFDDLESDRLVETAGAHKAMVLVALDAGLRRGEIIALRWGDVDLKARAVRVRSSLWRRHETSPKSGKGRSVPLSTRLAEALKAHRHLRGDRVFCREDGHQLNADDIRKILTGLCKKAGLRHVGWHVLRHSFASHLVQRGVPLRAVQELMGHADIRTTMRYAHLAPATLRSAIDALEVGTQWAQGVHAKGK